MRQRQRGLDRIDAALRSLRSPWKVLRETAKNGSTLGSTFVVLHPDRGIALVDLAPARPDAVITWLRVTLIRAGGGLFTVREPPITSVPLSQEEIAFAASRVEASFADVPPCGIGDKDWPETAVSTLTAQHAGLIPLQPGRTSASISGTESPRHASRPGAKPQAQSPQSDRVLPNESLAPPHFAMQPPRNLPETPSARSREPAAATGPGEPSPPTTGRHAPSANGPQLEVPRIDVPSYATWHKDFARINVPMPSTESPALRAQPEDSTRKVENPLRKLRDAGALRIDGPKRPVVTSEWNSEPSAKPREQGLPPEVSSDVAIQIPLMPHQGDAKDPPEPGIVDAEGREGRAGRARAIKDPLKHSELRMSPQIEATEPPSTERPRPKLYAERDSTFAPPASLQRRWRSPLWLGGTAAMALAIIMFARPREIAPFENLVMGTTQSPAREDATTAVRPSSSGGASELNFGDPPRPQLSPTPSAPSNSAARSQQAVVLPHIPPLEWLPGDSPGTPALPRNSASAEQAPVRPRPPSGAEPVRPPNAASLAANSAAAPSPTKGTAAAPPRQAAAQTRSRPQQAASARPASPASLADNSAATPSSRKRAETPKASNPAHANRTQSARRNMLASSTPLSGEKETAIRKPTATPKHATEGVERRGSASPSATNDPGQADDGDQDLVTIQGTEYVAGREPHALGSLPLQTGVAGEPAEQPVQAQPPKEEKPSEAPLPPSTDFAITPSGIMGPSGVVTPFADR